MTDAELVDRLAEHARLRPVPADCRQVFFYPGQWEAAVRALHKAIVALQPVASGHTGPQYHHNDEAALIDLRNALVRFPNEYLGPETDARLKAILDAEPFITPPPGR